MLFNRKQITNILAQHQNNIDRRAINPIFSSIRFQSDGENLYISSLDGERLLSHKIAIKLGVFDIFLPGNNLYELLRKSKEETFEIEEKENAYFIRIGKGEFKFSIFAEKSYPKWIDAHEISVEFDANELNKAIKLVKWAASSDEIRPFLNGVCFDIKDGTMNLCATDGLRLALYKIKTQAENGTWIFGRKSINDLSKLLDDCNDRIKISFGKNSQAVFVSQEAEVTWKSLLVAGQFPAYEKIIPVSSIAKFEAEAGDLSSAVERMLIMANTNQPIIMLELGSENRIAAENVLSSGLDSLQGSYTGPDMKISFNGRLLLEILNHLPNQKLVMELNNPYSPVLIRTLEIPEAKFILAPVKRNT